MIHAARQRPGCHQRMTHMTEPKLQEEQARQGETGKGVRYVLVISTIAAIVGLGIILAVFV